MSTLLERDMSTRHADPASLAHDEDPVGTLGGAPFPEPGPRSGEEGKAARKRRKREERLRHDAERPPDSFERFRVLAELVKEGRQIVDLVDHRARYALVVVGVLNAGVFVFMSRLHLLDTLPPGIRPWLIGCIVAYAAVTFLFLYYAVDCLRPRWLHGTRAMAANSDSGGTGSRHAPRGILYWETIANYELDAYQRAWSRIRMEEINAEVVIIAHQQARVIRGKYVVLGRLYSGLGVLVALASVLLGMYALFGTLQ